MNCQSVFWYTPTHHHVPLKPDGLTGEKAAGTHIQQYQFHPSFSSLLYQRISGWPDQNQDPIGQRSKVMVAHFRYYNVNIDIAVSYSLLKCCTGPCSSFAAAIPPVFSGKGLVPAKTVCCNWPTRQCWMCGITDYFVSSRPQLIVIMAKRMMKVRNNTGCFVTGEK